MGKQILGQVLLVFLANHVFLKSCETCHIKDRGYCPQQKLYILFNLSQFN